jgi:2-acylglycerol O-acyltransferase 1
MSGVPYVINNPMGASDMLKFDQPRGAGLWYYPMLGTGYPFPLTSSPRSLINNIYIFTRFVYLILSNPILKSIEQHRQAHGLPGKSATIAPFERKPELYVFASIREADYPLQVPEYVAEFGPIIPPRSQSTNEKEPSASYAALSDWLDQAPTIVICLGSLFTYDSSDIIPLATALCNVLLRYEKHHLLWKIPKKDQHSNLLDEIFRPLGGWKDSERIKIVDWIEMPMSEVLEHKTVVVNVNHGGANSYGEAMHAGVSQILLPQWIEHYDNAVKAEWLSIGTYGNKSTAPYFNMTEFEAALEKHLNPDTNAPLRGRAKECMEACKRAGGCAKYADVLMNISGWKAG